MANKKNLRAPWQPGECPNPKGRGKGSKSISTHLGELLQRKLESPATPISKEGLKISVAERIALTLVSKAVKGDMSAIREIQDRTEGKAVETVNSNNVLLVPDWVKDISQPVDR